MATNTGEEPKAAEAMDASLMVATRRGDCEKLKDLIIGEDATTMVVVLASSNQASSKEEKSSPGSMLHPLLAAAACEGNMEELKFLLYKGPVPMPVPSQEFQHQLEAYYPSDTRSLAMDDVTATQIEGGMYAASLEGVTVEGDTALHLLAANGGHGDNFTNCADFIYRECKTLLYKQNYNGDTPLHCAARTGNHQMVSHLIGLARGENRVECLLRKENNSKETALHEAVRFGDNLIVKELLRADPELATFPEKGPSPLYLAIFLEEERIAQTLHDESKDNVLSFSGPDGQNALHAAVLRRIGMVKMLLKWNRSLTSERDCNGSTPLHFLSCLKGFRVRRRILCFSVPLRSPGKIGKLLKANPAALFQPDNRGMFPIHVAASVGAEGTLARFIECCPSNAGLRDARGRTFLHIAADKSMWRVVKFACRTSSLACILNLQDTDGNTSLHVAVQAGCLPSFCSLLGNPQVHLNLANKRGQTPLDISIFNLPAGLYYGQSIAALIYSVLCYCNARPGSCRWDHYRERYINEKESHLQTKELEKLKDSTQTLCIGSVLIATVTFGATFALPGGYRADDHANGGTPTLAGSYAFDAFMIANALAFICSSVGTIGLSFAGIPMVDLKIRRVYIVTSVYFMLSSATSLAAAFALGVYVVLAPVAHKTAIAIGMMSPLVVISQQMESCLKWALLARPLCSRIGLIPALMVLSRVIIRGLLYTCWPLLLIFCWPAISRNH